MALVFAGHTGRSFTARDGLPRQGGQAQVFRTADGLHAIKLSFPGKESSLQREREALVQLHAENPDLVRYLIPVLDWGEFETEGLKLPFLVMPWFDQNLGEWASKASFEERLLGIEKAAEAVVGLHWASGSRRRVEYAWEDGRREQGVVVHRDIKPQNFLARGELQNDSFEVFLSDFGAARTGSFQTLSAQSAVFTEGYAPLEQTLPLRQIPDPSWDVFALGVTAFQLIVGLPPRATRTTAMYRRLTDDGRELMEVTRDLEIRPDNASLVQRLKELGDQGLASLVRFEGPSLLSEDETSLESAIREQLPHQGPQTELLASRLASDLASVLGRCLRVDPRRRETDARELRNAAERVRELLRREAIRPARSDNRPIFDLGNSVDPFARRSAPRADPPRSEPPRSEPPRPELPRPEPSRPEPPRPIPPRPEPPRPEPPRPEPPKPAATPLTPSTSPPPTRSHLPMMVITLLGLVLLLGIVGAVMNEAGMFKAQPAALRFDGEPLVKVKSLDPISLKSFKVLDKQGRVIEPRPSVVLTVEPSSVATLSDSMTQILPKSNGEAIVTASTARVKSSYKIVIEVPPDYAKAARAITRDDDEIRGSSSAPITIIVFGDYQCPYTAKLNKTMNELLVEFPTQIRWVFRDYPLVFHKRAIAAAVAAECAQRQGRFWDLHDLLLANQKYLEDADLEFLAGKAGLNVTSWKACTLEPGPTEEVQKDLADGKAAGITGTPTTFLNGELLSGAMPKETFEEAIRKALAKAR